jgi:hypothetical protein
MSYGAVGISGIAWGATSLVIFGREDTKMEEVVLFYISEVVCFVTT